MFDSIAPEVVPSGASLSLDDDNPPLLKGDFSPFFFSFHPWDDLIVTPAGRLSISPAKDMIREGIHGVFRDKGGVHWEGVAQRIRDTFGRVVLTDRKAYAKVYRKANAAERTPEQVIERWITIRWVAGRPQLNVDQAAAESFFEAAAWSIDPSDEQIASAEERSGHKLLHRRES